MGISFNDLCIDLQEEAADYGVTFCRLKIGLLCSIWVAHDTI